MKSKQDYIDTYRGITENLGIYGDNAEVLIQLLAEATYISEVEHAVYTQEASLEKASLMTSKIQHCMDDLYSVWRGSCPRVILRFRPTKYFDLKPYDILVTANGFKVWYLGYWTGKGGTTEETENTELMSGFTYGPVIIPPSLTGEEYTVVGLIARETIEREFQTTSNNTYYVECTEEDLSNDMWVKVEGEYKPVTRNFSNHIIGARVFDLTLPSFGSRLYVADILRETGARYSRTEITSQENLKIEACWFRYSLIDSYNPAELKKINIKGTLPISFGSEFQGSQEIAPGIIIVPESDRDTLTTIHYKANRDRYVNSIIRTNSDIGTVLEETYPEKVRVGGTSYRFSSSGLGSSLAIYYVPQVAGNLLTEEEISEFRTSRTGYYVTENLTVTAGTRYTAVFNLDLELYQSESPEESVKNILSEYENKFGIDFRDLEGEIRSLISKISNVRKISGFSIDYVSDSGLILDDLGKTEMYKNLESSYYQVNYVINSTIQQQS